MSLCSSSLSSQRPRSWSTTPACSSCKGCAPAHCNMQEPQALKRSCPLRQHPSPAPAASCSSQNQSHPSESLRSIKCLRNTAGSIYNATDVGKQGSKGVWKEETPGMLELHWRAPLPPGQESARTNWSTEKADRGEFG